MGTKTADQTTTEHEQDRADATGAPAEEAGAVEEVTEEAGAAAAADTDTDTDTEAGTAEDAGQAADAGQGAEVGQGAGAVVSVALGLVSLTGSWYGTVAAARETLVGQLQTSSSASVATQIKEIYGDAWHTTALWGGVFALAALVVAVVVLVRPAFGAPGRAQAPWIKSVAWAGVVVGVVGLLLAVLKYTDVLLGLPSAS
jgi:hypothetical protein